MIKDKKAKVNLRLDILSLLLSSIGFGGILYGFSSAGSKGWDSPLVYGTIIVGVISLFIFIVRQVKMETPLLNFRIYKYPMFALSSVITMVVNMALFSGMLLLPIYVQNLRGITPMDAGLLLMPGAILMAFMSPITGKLFDKVGGRILAIIGLIILTVTTYEFSKLSLTTTYTHLIILYSVRMFGMSMIMMPVSTNGLNQLPRRFYPHGTAMNNTLNQVAGAIGTALMVTIMTNRAESKGKELGAAAMKKMTQVAQTTHKPPNPAAIAEMKQHIANQALLNGINYSFLIATFICGVALVLALFIKRSRPAEDSIEQNADKQRTMTKKLAEN